MDERVPARQRIEAAGAVTISFGVLTGILAVVWLVIADEEAAGEAGTLQFALTLAVGVVFALLGWGVMRHNRTCAAAAATLAGVLVTGQLAGTFLGQGPAGGSLFFLVLPAIVLAGNWVAWREMHSPPDGG